MVARCLACGWESDHGYTATELQEIVAQTGGRLAGFNGEGEDHCPLCGANEILVVNED